MPKRIELNCIIGIKLRFELQNNGVLNIIVLKTNNNSFRMLLQCLNHQKVFKNTHFEGSKSCPVVLAKIAKTCPVVFLEK